MFRKISSMTPRRHVEVGSVASVQVEVQVCLPLRALTADQCRRQCGWAIAHFRFSPHFLNRPTLHRKGTFCFCLVLQGRAYETKVCRTPEVHVRATAANGQLWR